MFTDQPQSTLTAKERKSAYNRAWYAAGGDEIRARKLTYNRAWRKARSPVAKAEDRKRYNARARAAWASRSAEQRAERAAQQRARYAAKRASGQTKKKCRSVGSEYREALIRTMADRDGWACWVCREPVILQTGSVDHVISPLDGGAHALENMKIACKPCNTRRGRNAR